MNEVQINKIKKRADEYATSCFPYEKQFLEREAVVKCCVHVVTETIAELEKENELLKGRTEGFEKQILGLLYKYESVYKRFPDLKDAMNEAESILKENAELKENYFYERCIRSTCPYIHKVNRNCMAVGGFFTAVSNKDCPMMKNLNPNVKLLNAKKIIEKLRALYLSPVVTKDDVKRQDEILNEVEQFLKESE